MEEQELVNKSVELIRLIKKQGYMTKENIETIFSFINLINRTNEVVTYCTPCVEEKLKSLIAWVKPRMS